MEAGRREHHIVSAIWKDLAIVVSLVFVMLVLLEAGYRTGRHRAKKKGTDDGAQNGVIQGATLGLLGLLLAFSFSAAADRFFERQDLIVAEANAIGTALLRADLLDDARQKEFRAALKEYTEYRVSFTTRHGADLNATAASADVERQHTRIWSATMAGIASKPTEMLLVLPAINDMIDLHSVRVAATEKHIPMLVLGLLIAASLLSIASLGYSSGLGGHRQAELSVPLALLIGASLWITIDLDHPRDGLLRLSDAPLKALKFE
jgi:hypothetical protein